MSRWDIERLLPYRFATINRVHLARERSWLGRGAFGEYVSTVLAVTGDFVKFVVADCSRIRRGRAPCVTPRSTEPS